MDPVAFSGIIIILTGVIVFASAAIAHSIAEPKGYGARGFFALGLITGFIAPIIAACLPDLNARERRQREFFASLFALGRADGQAARPQAHCSYCKGAIPDGATHCRYCHEPVAAI